MLEELVKLGETEVKTVRLSKVSYHQRVTGQEVTEMIESVMHVCHPVHC